MKKNKKKNLLTVLLTLGMCFLLIVPLGVVAKFKSGHSLVPNSDLYLRQGDVYMLKDCENYKLVQGTSYVFELMGTDISNDDFNITITPNVNEDTDFEFTVGDEIKKFSEVKSLMNGFVIDLIGDRFILRPREISMVELLQSYYSDLVLEGIPTVIGTGVPYFKLTISNLDKTRLLTVCFSLDNNPDSIYIVEDSTDEGDIHDLPVKPDRGL